MFIKTLLYSPSVSKLGGKGRDASGSGNSNVLSVESFDEGLGRLVYKNRKCVFKKIFLA